MRTVVVGGGIAGLAAAWFLASNDDSTYGDEVLVIESSAQVGGKLRTGEIAGVSVDVGAEAMLNRRPEGTELARAAGLELVHPATAGSRLWTRGALRPLPRTLLGVPLDLDGLAESGVLSPEGLERARHETVHPPEETDVSVAELLGSRFGAEVVERLAEPLLGGVYAGHATELSARAAVPQLVALLARNPSLTAAAQSDPATPDTPVFAGLEGGLGRLPRTLAETGGFTVRTGATVRELTHRPGGGFRLTVGSTRAPELVECDRVVLATPAAPTARLLREVAPAAATELAGIEYASMAIVTLAVPESADLGTDSSGFLVPPVDGRAIKAATYSFNKWAWVGDAGRANGVRILRASLGRHREEAVLQVDDAELVRLALTDLREATGVDLRPVDTHVQRWGGGLPQYAVGHLDRIARARAGVAAVPGLAACGAAYEGVGIPACIASARRAVAQLTQAQ